MSLRNLLVNPPMKLGMASQPILGCVKDAEEKSCICFRHDVSIDYDVWEKQVRQAVHDEDRCLHYRDEKFEG